MRIALVLLQMLPCSFAFVSRSFYGSHVLPWISCFDSLHFSGMLLTFRASWGYTFNDDPGMGTRIILERIECS